MTQSQPGQIAHGVPQQTLAQVFVRFLRFGSLAWGGPVAQIAMLQRELVEEERWISPGKFNRAYALYQTLPGPEAHELCVYFGTLARGRLGGLVAGLGFMLPGLLSMLALSWVYVRFGVDSPALAAAFAGIQAAVLALIARGTQRIASHALVNPLTWSIAIGALAATLAGAHFAVVLVLAGLCRQLARDHGTGRAGLVLAAFGALALWAWVARDGTNLPTAIESVRSGANPGPLRLFGSGLQAGMFSFGGAYTAIPFMLHDAVETGRWMTREQFLDGIALGGMLPAPLVVFATFVGFVAGGTQGALASTAGMFLPAFAFTLVGHGLLERAIDHPRLQRFLDGVTAGVVGLIAATALELAPTCIPDLRTALCFALAWAVLARWRAKLAIAVVVPSAGLTGWLLLAR
jgi:chromate transporter